MQVDVAGLIAIAMSLIGFITVWIKLGHNKGREEATIRLLEKKVEKNEADINGLGKETRQNIMDLKNETRAIQIEIARSMGTIEAKLDGIKEVVAELKSKGGRRAAAKSY